MTSTPTEPVARPRVEGDREQEIFDATLSALAEVGYDRLTMDSVAQAAKASKATLYRRWSSKAALVIDALIAQKQHRPAPDTGALRTDLVASFCGAGGLTDHHETAVFASLITALSRDTEFAERFRRDVVGPKMIAARVVFERARDRGEIADDVDLDLLVPALAGTVLHRMFVLGEQPSADLVTRVIDQIILPAATRGRLTPTQPITTPTRTSITKDNS